jgi:hypothetical protein
VIAAVLAVSVATVATVATIAASQSSPKRRSDVYSSLAQQLKQQLPRLVSHLQQPPLAAPPLVRKVAPDPNLGYSCAIGTRSPCSLRPCVKYAQSAVQRVDTAVAIARAPASSGCTSTAKALPRLIPISTR